MGRPRKRSPSSSSEDDTSAVTYLSETRYLRTVAADNEITFDLHDATIYAVDGVRMVNFLDVVLSGPFIVRGQLVISGNDEEQRNALLHRQLKNPAYVEIPESSKICIGLDESATGLFWARGSCGWFRIYPSRQYRSIYDYIVRGIELYYSVSDHIIGTTIAKRKFEEVLFHVAAENGMSLTLEDMICLINEYKTLFLSQFLKEESGQVPGASGPHPALWKDTPFYKRLVDQNQALFKKIEKLLTKAATIVIPAPDPVKNRKTVSELPIRKPPQPAPEEARKASVSRAARSQDMEIDHAPPQATATATATATYGTSIERNTDMNDPAVPLLATIVKDILDGLLATAKITEITPIRMRSKLHQQYNMPEYEAGLRIIDYHAVPLLKLLDKQLYSGTPFYQWLSERPSQPPMGLGKTQPHQIASRLVRRKHTKAKPATQPSTQPTQRDGEESGGSRDPEPAPQRRRGRPPGQVSSLRLASTAKKRYRSPQPETSDSSISTKRSKRLPPGYRDENEAMLDSAAEAESPENDEEDSDSSDEDRELIQLEVKVEERIPSLPQELLENTYWACEHEGCDFGIDGSVADNDEQTRLFRGHFETHQQAEQIELAVREGRGRHLPVEHLLEKIRSMGERLQLVDDHGVVAPQPIKRRLLV